jgi:hypothetical protein
MAEIVLSHFQIAIALRIVDCMKMIYSEQGANSRYWQTLLTLTSVFLALVIAANLTSHVSSVCFKQNDAEVRNLFPEIEKLKGAFEFVERSTLDIELCKAKLPTMEGSESSSSPV